jgi:iron complex outermembrane receptor protein
MLSLGKTDIDGYRDFSRARSTAINSTLVFRPTSRDELLLAINSTDQPQSEDPGGIDAAQATLDRRSPRAFNVQFDSGEELNQQRIGGVYKTDRLGGELMLRNYYVWRDFTNRLPFVSGGAVDLQRFFYGVGAQYGYEGFSSSGLRLIAGFDLDRQDDDRIRFDNNNGTIGAKVFDQKEKVDSSGIFLLGQYKLSDTWSMSAGLRYDRVEFSVDDNYLADGDDSGQLDFDRWSPSLAVNYKTERGVLFASWSRSFETPTTTELANPDGTGGFSQSLEPQIADNFEVGFKSSLDSIYYELSVFHIELQDELIPFEIASSPGRTFYSNAGSSTRDGLEASAAWRGDNGFSVNASYTWSDFVFDEFVEGGNDFGGKRLPGLPEHFAYLGLSYATGNGISATFETLFSGNLYADNANTVSTDSYTVSNIRLAYEWLHDKWMIRPYIGINNIFDELYNSNVRINAFGGRYYEPAPDRNIYAGFVVNFRRSPSAN